MSRWSGVVLAAVLAGCSGNAIKPIPGQASAGTNAAGGAGASSGSTSTASTTGASAASSTGSSTSGATTSSASSSTSSTGASSSAGASSSTSTTGSATSGSSGASASSGSGSGGTASSSGSTGSASTSSSTGGSSGSTGASLGFVRLVDLLDDQTLDADFCTRPTGTSTWSAPALAALGGSLPSPGATLYFGFDDPGGAGTSYDVAVVAAGTPDCTVNLFSSTFQARAGLRRTFVATGSFTGPDFIKLTDDAPPTSGTDTAVRFTNASPDSATTAVDVGLPGGGSFNEVFDNIAYKSSSTQSSYVLSSGTVDGNGYLVHAAFGSQGVGVRDHFGNPNNVLANVSDTFDANQQHSLFFSGTSTAGFALSSCLDDPSLTPDASNHGVGTCH